MLIILWPLPKTSNLVNGQQHSFLCAYQMSIKLNTQYYCHAWTMHTGPVLAHPTWNTVKLVFDTNSTHIINWPLTTGLCNLEVSFVSTVSYRGYPIIPSSNFDLTHILGTVYLVCQNVSKKLTWSTI